MTYPRQAVCIYCTDDLPKAGSLYILHWWVTQGRQLVRTAMMTYPRQAACTYCNDDLPKASSLYVLHWWLTQGRQLVRTAMMTYPRQAACTYCTDDLPKAGSLYVFICFGILCLCLNFLSVETDQSIPWVSAKHKCSVVLNRMKLK